MLLSNIKSYVEDFFKFCGLFRISELYQLRLLDFGNFLTLYQYLGFYKLKAFYGHFFPLAKTSIKFQNTTFLSVNSPIWKKFFADMTKKKTILISS